MSNKLKEVDKGMCEALRELMKPELDEAEKNAEERTILRLVKEGLLSIKDAAKQLKISEKALKAKLN